MGAGTMARWAAGDLPSERGWENRGNMERTVRDLAKEGVRHEIQLVCSARRKKLPAYFKGLQ